MKNSIIRIISLFLIAVLCILPLASCGASNDKGTAYEEIGKNENDMLMDGITNEQPEKGEANADSDFIKDKNAKIIKTITTHGETKEFDPAYESIKKYINESGGYVESSNISGGESYSNNRESARTASFVIRIPAEKLEAFNKKINALLNVTSFSENTVDVSLEYTDIESRLQTLKSKKVALEAMLEKAVTIDEIIMIQDNLYDVIADIEAYQSKLNFYDNKVNYSTVNLTVYEVIEFTETEEDPSFFSRIGNAFSKTWTFFGELCLDIAVAFVWLMPYIIIPVIIVVAIICIIRCTKKKKKKKAESESSEE